MYIDMITKEYIHKINTTVKNDLETLNISESLDLLLFLYSNQFYFDYDSNSYPFKENYNTIINHISQKYSVVDQKNGKNNSWLTKI